MKKNIKERINDYKSEYELSEVGTPLIIIAELLSEIKDELKNITNKIYE